MTRLSKQYMGAASALAVAVSLACAGGASAQVASSTLRGTIYEGAAVEAGGTITATEISTGYVSRGRIGADGGYVLPGLRPGTYRIDATSAAGQTVSDTVTLSLGQVATLDLDVAAVTGSTEVTATDVGDIIVTGRRLFEVRTPEVATNVSQAQINNLPQINRNFLNFAALAPGLRVTEGDRERTISAGGQTPQAINVFIDGQNQKSTIIDGGVAGQDDSRGNPFPQAGVQEFRVISQNFKAEYEQAGSAIITAVTRSGTNDFSGDAFVTYMDADWSETRSIGGGDARPERLQYGFSVGGPIIEDRLHYFLAYEKKDEDRPSSVSVDAAYAGMFPDDVGTFAAPFEQDLIFGKLSFNASEAHRFELSGTWREEQDIRDFGGGTSYDRAQAINAETRSIVLKHQWQGAGFFNEASVDFFGYTYNPTALNFSEYGREYIVFRDNCPAGADPVQCPVTAGFQYNPFNRDRTVFNTGGRSDNQFIEQENLTFKNDLTFTEVEWMGSHTIKLGAKYSMQSMYVNKQFGRNPQFRYDIDGRPEINGSSAIPVSVFLGAYVPPVDVDNNVIGLYIQDDWQITPQLEINLGLRWDYEDNAVNNDFVTPTRIRDALAAIEAIPGYDFPSYFNPADYISDGDRDAFTGAWQPRIGFSYDVFDDERTVLFGGAGRYYDRIGFNFAFDERFKYQQFNKEIFFSNAGGPISTGGTGTVDTVAWDPIYLTAAGLDPLLDAAPGAGEVFLLHNEAAVPYTDQFNLGIRQRLGDWSAEVTLAKGSTHDEASWYIANRAMDGSPWSGPSPSSVGFTEFRNQIFISIHDRERRFDAVYVKLDKPYNAADGWGFNVAYTYMDAEQNGSRDNGYGAFDFDYTTPDQSPWYPSSFDERHRVVASGMVDLPMDFRLSGILTLGSGTPFSQWACPDAIRPQPYNPDACWNGGRPEKYSFIVPNAWAYRQLDLRLTKTLELWDGHAVEAIFDAINVFNHKNYSAFEQCLCSAQYGDPREQHLPTRSFQVGLRYRW
ncbi:MAG TPA: TonB-dependent receptor [Phenylobacterium sp.]|nr:TonB-dependent receptor [Phenylobacterium sp.]